MVDERPGLDALDRLEPREVLSLLESLDPADPSIRSVSVNDVIAAVDPRKLGDDEFVRMLATLDRLADGGADLDLGAAEPETFAQLIARASKDQVDALMQRSELRIRLLDEIFARMQAHFRPDRAGSTTAVVHFRFTGGDGAGGYDRYEAVVQDGACQARRGKTREPRTTITVDPADFLKLITHNASAPVLFMTGKLKVRGDLGFAAGMMNLFDLPRA